MDIYGSTNTNKANIEKLWPIRDVFGVKKKLCCHAINWEKGVANHCQKPISHERLKAINLRPINERCWLYLILQKQKEKGRIKQCSKIRKKNCEITFHKTKSALFASKAKINVLKKKIKWREFGYYLGSL